MLEAFLKKQKNKQTFFYQENSTKINLMQVHIQIEDSKKKAAIIIYFYFIIVSKLTINYLTKFLSNKRKIITNMWMFLQIERLCSFLHF